MKNIRDMADTEKSKRKIAHGPTVHAVRRAKYQAKQEQRRLQEQQQTETSNATSSCLSSDEWFRGRKEYAVFITSDDVHRIRERKPTSADGVDIKSTLVDAKEDSSRLDRIASWIEPFLDLKEAPKQLNGPDGDEATAKERLFIAEGTEPVRLMIQKCLKTSNSEAHDDEYSKSPPVRIVSILCKPATFFDPPVCLLDELVKQQCISDNSSACPFKIIVGTEETLSAIVGFPVARGAMACGIVPSFKQPFQWLKTLINTTTTSIGVTNSEKANNVKTQSEVSSILSTPPNKPRRILALDAISNTSNMGSLLRTAAAFGIDAIILSDDSCDAWYRQAVRVSMGHVITVPTIRVADIREGLGIDDIKCSHGGLPSVLRWLREEMKVQCFAAVVDDDNTSSSDILPPLVSLESLTSKRKANGNLSSWVCVLGNEGNGIRQEVVNGTDHRVRISMMNADVDSLSLPVAAGILIHGLCLI